MLGRSSEYIEKDVSNRAQVTTCCPIVTFVVPLWSTGLQSQNFSRVFRRCGGQGMTMARKYAQAKFIWTGAAVVNGQ